MLGCAFSIRDFDALDFIELSFFKNYYYFLNFCTCLLKLTLFLTNVVVDSR